MTLSKDDGEYSDKKSTRSVDSEEHIETKIGKKKSLRRHTITPYESIVTSEEEDDPLRELLELESEKITAADILVENTTIQYGHDQKGESKPIKPPSTPPKHLPSGAILFGNKYHIPKLINPLEIDLRRYQLKELRDAYDCLENPTSGMVPVENISTLVRACGFEPKQNEVKDIIDKVNPQYPGNLTTDEFIQVFKYKLNKDDPVEEIERAFKLMDLQKIGCVTLENLKEVAKMIDYEIEDEELQEMIDESFPGPDGNATLAGFIKLMTTKSQADYLQEKDERRTEKTKKRENVIIQKQTFARIPT